MKKDKCAICEKAIKYREKCFPVKDKIICVKCFYLINPLGIG